MLIAPSVRHRACYFGDDPNVFPPDNHFFLAAHLPRAVHFMSGQTTTTGARRRGLRIRGRENAGIFIIFFLDKPGNLHTNLLPAGKILRRLPGLGWGAGVQNSKMFPASAFTDSPAQAKFVKTLKFVQIIYLRIRYDIEFCTYNRLQTNTKKPPIKIPIRSLNTKSNRLKNRYR